MAEVYPRGTDQRIADPDWILRVDKEGWVALTKDYSVVRDHRNVLAETKLRLFVYNNANITGPEMVDRLKTNFNSTPISHGSLNSNGSTPSHRG